MRRWMPGMFAVLLGADEVMKQYVEDYMEPGEERRIAGGKLLLRRIHNPGFALGTLEDQPKIVRNVSVAAAVPVFAWWLSLIWRKGHWIEKTGSTLAAAGAAGNLLDRLLRGKVVDYIGFRTRSSFFSKLTANLADLYLAAGSLLMTVRKIL